MFCPLCASPLTQESHSGVQIDTCDGCDGLWFDRGNLEGYWRATDASDEPPGVDAVPPGAGAARAMLSCPRCRSDSLAVRRVDVFNGGRCSACDGVWLAPASIPRLPDQRAPASESGRGLIGDALEIALMLFAEVLRRR